MSRRDLLLSLKYATVEACFSVPMLNLTLTQFPFVIGFAVIALDWSATAIGLLAAIHHIGNFLQPPLTSLLRRRFSLYQIMVIGFVLNALPWAFLFTLRWLGTHGDWVFGIIVLTATVANSVCAVAWSAAMSDLVPLHIRGRYFGRRNLTFGFWTLVVVLAAGQIATAGGNTLEIFGVIYSAAAAARMIGLYFLTRMKFPKGVMERGEVQESLGDYLGVFRDRNYFWLMLFVGVWGFALNLGQPFYSVYVLRELPFDMGGLTLLTTLAALGGLVGLRSWGVLADRFGNKPVLMVSAFLWAGGSLPGWLLAGPQHHLHLYALFFVTGFMTAGFQLCQFNLMIKLVPARSRSHYISVFLAFTSLITAFGPLAGGKLLAVIPDQLGVLMGQPILRFHVLFVGSLLLCFLSIHLLHLMSEPAERPLRELVRVMRHMREFNPMLGFLHLAEYMFTPRQITRFAQDSLQSLKRQTHAVGEVGEELVEEGWRALRKPFIGPAAPPPKELPDGKEPPPGAPGG